MLIMYENTYPTRKRHSRFRRRRRISVIPALILLTGLLAGCMQLLVERPGEDHVLDILETEPAWFKDTTEPQLAGVRDLTVYKGDTVSYLRGVTATDDYDSAPVVTVDSSYVDLTEVGCYDIVYTATDSAGNSTSTMATVTVLEKADEGFVDMQTINAAADEKLESLLWDGATTQEKVYAIYRWARNSLHYGGHSDRTDWRQTGYTMLTEGRGDCFGYYAVTKLLLERLGIPNLDVRKVKNSEDDSDHFWSLVSVDGGESYYHFDATPRWGDGDDFCLVTDDFLDSYSADHKNSHNRDKSLYPETPEDAL